MKSVFSSFFLVVLFVVQSCGSDSDPIIEVPSAGSFSIYNKSESSYVKNHGDVTIGDTLLITFTPNPEFAAENFRTTISVNGKTIMGNEYIVGEDSETLDISAKSEAETSSHILCEQYEASLKLLYANIKLDYVVAMAELYPFAVPTVSYKDNEGQLVKQRLTDSDFEVSEFEGTLFHTHSRRVSYRQPLGSKREFRVTYEPNYQVSPTKPIYYFSHDITVPYVYVSYVKNGASSVNTYKNLSIDLSVEASKAEGDVEKEAIGEYLNALKSIVDKVSMEIDRNGKIRLTRWRRVAPL